jgi:hypothetical protein
MTKGLKQEDIVSKLVCRGVDGVSAFQGLKSKVIIWIQHQYVPFVNGVNCMVHQTNIVIQTFQTYLCFSH